jgi:hypothetical protein
VYPKGTEPSLIISSEGQTGWYDLKEIIPGAWLRTMGQTGWINIIDGKTQQEIKY